MDGARPAGSKGLEVRLLGPLEVLHDGKPVSLGGLKPRTLLGVLALDLGRVVSVDHLVEALWPGEAPETASHAVQVYVSQLRKALGPVIATRVPGYVLELEPKQVDLHRFTRLADEGRTAFEGGSTETAEATYREALALWRGPALADFLYEPFAQTDIARLEELRTVVLEERIETDLALSRHAELVPELEALVQSQPHRERPRAQLMLALYRSGRQAEALSAYRAARDTLVDELGIEPGPELKGLEAAILRQDESLVLEEEALAKPVMQFRRLVTILFCDVVESMALAEVLDPEALGRVLHRYFETVSAALTRHGGTVEKFAGDAVMAAFGVPISHEDDALRAARAALEIQAGVAALSERLVQEHGVGLEARVGIAAGEVVATPTETRQRLVTGDAVGVASRLEQAAGPGEILVGEVVGRLIDHAARLEPLGELKVKSRKAPIRMFRLLEITPVAPAFERRLDAKLVGRKRELAAIRKSMKRAADTGSPGLVVVSGPPGIGKSRLATEVASRAKGVTRLSGRCLSYGDGITYWPLREVLDGAPPGDERDAVVAALEADTPPPAPEIAWLFRRFCEVAAHEQPLVLVFDDAHWAEPTFLELVEHLVDRGEGPILVVCVAREELLEARPALVEDRDNAALVELDSLSSDEADALVDGLGGKVLETDRRDRIAEAAEGNPFFLEQLLALELEGGLARGPIPETVQALLAARLDRLGPGERAVLERGSVIGKEFRLDDVTALLEPEAAPTADAHVRTLVARGFVRPAEPGEFAFRHVLVQEAVYRAAPKRLRAELHERFVDRFEARRALAGDVDEFAGYHLEQAYRLRTELGESDRRTARLADDAGRRLGRAGIRAMKRGDNHATTNLLLRATTVLEADHQLRRELLTELAIAQRASGDPSSAARTLAQALAESRTAGDKPTEARARIELEYSNLRQQRGAVADGLLDAVAEGIPIFERIDNHRALARAWLFFGWVHGGRRANHAAWLDSAERALTHNRTAGWTTSSCLGEIGIALYWGPTPVNHAVARCEQLLREESSDRVGGAYLSTFLGGLRALEGDFVRARQLIQSAWETLDDAGYRESVLAYSATVLGEVELLAEDRGSAVDILLPLCQELAERSAQSQLASRASDLAEALVRDGRIMEAEEWIKVAERNAAADDVNAQMMWRPVRAKLLARRGELDAAERLAREGIRLGDETDDLSRRAKAYCDLAEILLRCDRAADAAAAFVCAAQLFERKGNLVGLARTRALQTDLAVA
jgi:class 3 adenylate cyclase